MAGRHGGRQAWWQEQEPQARSRQQLKVLWGFKLSKLTTSYVFTPANGALAHYLSKQGNHWGPHVHIRGPVGNIFHS